MACCPTNVARTLASLAAYLATADGGGIQIHQYVESRIRTTLDDGRPVGLEVTTGYPRDGTVTVRITESDGRPWALTLRVPDWATGAELTDPGGTRRPAGSGTVVVEWPFAVGDEVTLALPSTRAGPTPDPRIDAIRGCVAVERGPIVMCAESVDLPAGVTSTCSASIRRCRLATRMARSSWPPGWSSRRRNRGRTARVRTSIPGTPAGRHRAGPDSVPQLGQPRSVDDARVDPGHERLERMSAR